MNTMIPRQTTDWVHWYIAEQGARIVAQSGNPRDRFHIGKHILQGLKDDPHFIAQIDGATGESETNKSLMERSVRCAIAMKNYGLKTGDVIVVMAPNHIHLAVPVYAAMYLGVAVAAVVRTLTVDAVSDVFALCEPNLVFCQSESAEDVHVALRRFDENAQIVLFDDGCHQNLNDFVKKYGDETEVDDFIPSSIDPEDTVSFLVFTSGTTGPPKFAKLTHMNLMLIDIDTQADITEPNQTGELWVKGPQVFKGYLKNPKATAEVLTEDGWLKTGDLMYRDEYWNFFFVERLKLMLNYKTYKFFPLEMEVTIGRHAGVEDVAVTGVPSPEGDCPVACIVPRPGCQITADDVNQLVENNQRITKKIEIRVIFLEKLPTTSTGKIDRRKLKEIALQMDKE